jgi:hypothetical protein
MIRKTQKPQHLLKRIHIAGTVLLAITFVYGCSNTNQVSRGNIITPNYTQEKDLKEFLGQKITIIGKAVNTKLGALLEVDGGTDVWMDNLQNWPEGYYVYENDAETKTVSVTGTLFEKYDLCVVNPNDSIIKQGVNLPEGSTVREASHRYLLKDYIWTIVE